MSPAVRQGSHGLCWTDDIRGFNRFVLRGNVIDLAVAVVIGAAFTAIVTSLVTNILTPLIGALFNVNNLSTALIVKISTSSGGTDLLQNPGDRNVEDGRVLKTD